MQLLIRHKTRTLQAVVHLLRDTINYPLLRASSRLRVGRVHLCPLLLIRGIDMVHGQHRRRVDRAGSSHTKNRGAFVFVLELTDYLDHSSISETLALHIFLVEPIVFLQYHICTQAHGFVDCLTKLESSTSLEIYIWYVEVAVSWYSRLESEFKVKGKVVAWFPGDVCVEYAAMSPDQEPTQ
jgi:hypothetical protein